MKNSNSNRMFPDAGGFGNRLRIIVTIVFAGIAPVMFLDTSANAMQQAETKKNPRVPATVRAFESAEIYAKVGGYVTSVNVDIGDTVKAGQVLAVIDAPELNRQLIQKAKLLELAKAKVEQSKAKTTEVQSSLDALRASVKEAATLKAKKQSMLDFERVDCERIARLASTGAIKAELLDKSRFKMQAAEADLQSANAKVTTAKAYLSGGNAAVKRSEADSIAANAQVEVAKADMEYTQKMIDYLTIKAPWDGKITQRMYDAGSFVQSAEGNSAAKPLFRLVRDDKVRVAFSLSQKDLKGLKKGVPVSLTDIDALPGETFKGTVSRFSAELDPKTRMMQVEMDLDNADGKLKSGYFGYATVKLN